MDLPSISVIVPTRRRVDLVKRCVNSLIGQDYPRERCEIIVVEDGSHVVVESLRSTKTRLTAIPCSIECKGDV